MESQSSVSAVQPEAWSSVLIPSKKPYLGQALAWAKVYANPGQLSWLFILPTGYGKTITAVGVYVILRALGIVDHLLVFCANDTQRKQWLDVLKVFDWLGCQVGKVIKVEKEDKDLRYAENGGEVFVSTYHNGYRDEAYWQRLTAKGSWLVVHDECHHLEAEAVWKNCIVYTRATRRVYMSATPIRSDQKPLLGVPASQTGDGRWELVPDVEVSFEQAMDEGAIRWVRGRIEEFTVDVKFGDRDAERLTMAEVQQCMREDGVPLSRMQKWEVKQKIRYTSKYLSVLFINACNELAARNMRSPGQHQMLVCAMTNAHAKVLVEQLNSIGGDGYADRVGEDRSAAENEEVMERFMTNGLQCLVNVAKVGEGFDNPRVSVVVILNLIESEPAIVQIIGRGLRVNYSVTVPEDNVLIVFAPKDSPAEEVIVRFCALLDQHMKAGKSKDPAPSESLYAIPSSQTSLEAVEHLGTTMVGGPPGVDAAEVKLGADFLVRSGVPAEAIAQMGDGVLASVWRNHRGAAGSGPAGSPTQAQDEKTREALASKQVDSAARIFTRNVLVLRKLPSVERSYVGDVMKAVHRQWMKRNGGNGHRAMMTEEFEAKLVWLRAVNGKMMETRVVPSWVP